MRKTLVGVSEWTVWQLPPSDYWKSSLASLLCRMRLSFSSLLALVKTDTSFSISQTATTAFGFAISRPNNSRENRITALGILRQHAHVSPGAIRALGGPTSSR